RLAVPPRTHHHVIVIGLALGLQRKITVDCAPHVLLVPQSLNPHCRHGRWPLGDKLIERLPLPECVVIGMLHHLAGPGELVDAVSLGIVARRARAAEAFVVVVVAARYGISLALLGCLPPGVIEVHLPESAVVEPVITHPAIHHRTLRRRDLERWM